MVAVAARPTRNDVAEAILRVRLRRRQREIETAERQRHAQARLQEIENDWRAWLPAVLPRHFRATSPEELDLGDHHIEFFEWLWAIDRGTKPDPFAAFWARGGLKSTCSEASTVILGARGRRRYGVYVCASQPRADDHVQTVASMLESPEVEAYYPLMAERAIGKFGSSKGWRRNRLRTASGFILDGIGLEVAARGVKIDEQRPDFFIFDDLDAKGDTAEAVKKKIETLTRDLLPAGSDDSGVLYVQNLIHRNGIAAQLADGRAAFLVNRRVSGPHPALRNAKYAHLDGRMQITAGEPTWGGQDIERCQALLDEIGYRAFRAEAQHEVRSLEGSLWEEDWIDEQRLKAVPCNLVRIVVAIDPADTSTPTSDPTGIAVAGLGEDGHFYVLDSVGVRLSPAGWAKQSLDRYDQHRADLIVAERNNGGEMVEATIRTQRPNASVGTVYASRGKVVRAEPIAALYEDKKVHHIGVFPVLEDQMLTPQEQLAHDDERDALVWALTELSGDSAPIVSPGGSQAKSTWR